MPPLAQTVWTFHIAQNKDSGLCFQHEQYVFTVYKGSKHQPVLRRGSRTLKSLKPLLCIHVLWDIILPSSLQLLYIELSQVIYWIWGFFEGINGFHMHGRLENAKAPEWSPGFTLHRCVKWSSSWLTRASLFLVDSEILEEGGVLLWAVCWFRKVKSEQLFSNVSYMKHIITTTTIRLEQPQQPEILTYTGCFLVFTNS